MCEKQAGCDPNTQVLLEVESRNVVCRGTVEDEQTVPWGTSKLGMGARGVVYGKAPRGGPLFDTDDVFL